MLLPPQLLKRLMQGLLLSDYRSSSRCVDDAAATPLRPNLMDSLAILSSFSLRAQDSNASTVSRSPYLLVRIRLFSTLLTALGPPSAPHCHFKLSPAPLLDNLTPGLKRERSKETKERGRGS